MINETLSDYINQARANNDPNLRKGILYLEGLVEDKQLDPNLKLNEAALDLSAISMHEDLSKQEKEVATVLLDDMFAFIRSRTRY
jgi:hypothetical protein